MLSFEPYTKVGNIQSYSFSELQAIMKASFCCSCCRLTVVITLNNPIGSDTNSTSRAQRFMARIPLTYISSIRPVYRCILKVKHYQLTAFWMHYQETNWASNHLLTAERSLVAWMSQGIDWLISDYKFDVSHPSCAYFTDSPKDLWGQFSCQTIPKELGISQLKGMPPKHTKIKLSAIQKRVDYGQLQRCIVKCRGASW